MGSSEKFCLRWNDFEANISNAFLELKEEKDFTDVTLVWDVDQQLKKHTKCSYQEPYQLVSGIR